MDHTLESFLTRALPWPTQDTPGWVNVHWRPAGKKGITGGRAFKDPSECLSFLRWLINHPEIAHDIYFCTSLQEEDDGPTAKGNGRRARRSARNSLSSKLLFADVDKYSSKTEAYAAVLEFCKASESPFPTALVDSGNGLHVYWFLSEALPRELWLNTAARLDGLLNQFSLKHDNVSTDVARILRVPETFNFKQEPKKPVVLKLLNGDVDLRGWRSLADAVPTPAKEVGPLRDPGKAFLLPDAAVFVDPAALAGQGPARVFQRMPLEERVPPGTLDPTPIVALCPMFKTTLATGGEGVQQPVWHQQALACTFMLGGQELFHDLSHKHKDYSRADADAMYQRKLVDRYTKGLGYPSCATFEREGCQECKDCPIKGQVVSPLNIKPPKEEGLILKDGPPPIERVPLDIKEGFAYGDEVGMEPGGSIFAAGDSRKKPWVEIITTRIYWAHAYTDERGKAFGVRFKTQTNREKTNIISLSPEDLADSKTIYRKLSTNGVGVMWEKEKIARLMTSFRGRKQVADEAARAVQYGWIYPESCDDEEVMEPVGFAFGGQVFQKDGQIVPAINADEALQEVYGVRGGIAPWYRALAYILSTQGPEVQVLAAAGFAAPLVKFTGYCSVAIMGVGDSGGMKSAASAVGLGIWANPKLAAQKPNASNNAILKRMGALRHLPTACDDLQKEHFDAAKALIMQITQGADGSKLTQNREERPQGEWDSIIVTGSNRSLAEHIEQTNKNDSSALVRCFEFNVPKLQDDNPGFRDQDEIAPAFSALNQNHGHIGLAYAKKLGSAPGRYIKLVKECGKEITRMVGRVDSEERFWWTGATAILAGAVAGNELVAELGHPELQFDLVAVKKFVVQVFLDMRLRVNDARCKGSSKEFVKKHMENFFNNHAGPNNMMLWTQDVGVTPGRHEQQRILQPQGRDYDNMKKVAVRWVVGKQLLMIGQHEFYDFLRKFDISTLDMTKGLRAHYDAEFKKLRLGSGTSVSLAKEVVILIKVKPNSWLHEIMHYFLTPADLRNIVPQLPAQNQDQ
jgi:hypothetical protein